MDLQAAHKLNGTRWSLTRVAAFLCFAAACGLLIGSLNGGPAAARAMLGKGEPYSPVPYFFSDQYDLGMEYTGWVNPGQYDRVVFRGDPTVGDAAGSAPEFLAFWVRRGAVLAGMNANVWDVTETIADLVRAGLNGRAVDLDALADPEIPLGDLLS